MSRSWPASARIARKTSPARAWTRSRSVAREASSAAMLRRQARAARAAARRARRSSRPRRCACEVPRASAMSAISRPPKTRRPTTSACRGCRPRRRSRAAWMWSNSIQVAPGAFAGASSPSSSIFSAPPPRFSAAVAALVVDQHLPQDARAERQALRARQVGQARGREHAHAGLVDHRRRLQRVVAALGREEPARDALELGIEGLRPQVRGGGSRRGGAGGGLRGLGHGERGFRGKPCGLSGDPRIRSVERV